MAALLFARNLTQAVSPGVKSAERSRTLHLRDGELAKAVANLEDVRPSHHDEHDCSSSHHDCNSRRLRDHLVSIPELRASEDSSSYTAYGLSAKRIPTLGRKKRGSLRPVGFQGRTEV